MRAPVVMIQGTASGVGKSVIAAGLCRVLRRRGLRVAPFKAQNMALNVAVTREGGEIARSIAVQAAAAGIAPTVAMNPILLKPTSPGRSQVIVRGRVLGTFAAQESFSVNSLWPIVAASLDALRAQYEVIVAEGAGSPVELNLRDHDVVNMRLARYADAAVVLVGDIDRGGVFAQLIGTLDLLPAGERTLVRGMIVNRFRGDPALFIDGVRILEEHTGVPVFGVVPVLRDLGLAEEDSVPLDDPPRALGATHEVGKLRIVVVRLPHLANFDDFDPLARTGNVALSYVDRPAGLADADLIVLPGSKSTVADLGFLRAHGLAPVIVAAHARGVPILGICGGFQMLGQEIRDPYGVESSCPNRSGLGLLAHHTVFAREKQTAQVRARVIAPGGLLAGAHGEEIAGYEMHHGRIQTDAASALFRIVSRSGAPVDDRDGALSSDGLVAGTHLHGLFENIAIRQALLHWLMARHRTGPAALDRPGRAPRDPDADARAAAEATEPDPYERWADHLEATLDLPRLFAATGLDRIIGNHAG